MMQLVKAALDSRWDLVKVGDNYKTPDYAKGSPFSISSVSDDSIKLSTSGGSLIGINRKAFLGVLIYLITNNHIDSNREKIGANKDSDNAGPLCLAARRANESDVMVISYIIPMLGIMGFVGIDGGRPNTTWLL